MRYKLKPKGRLYSTEVDGIAQPAFSLKEASYFIMKINNVSMFCNWADIYYKRDWNILLDSLYDK